MLNKNMKLWCDEEKQKEMDELKVKYGIDEIKMAAIVLYGEYTELNSLTILMLALLNNFMKKGLHLANHGRKVA